MLILCLASALAAAAPLDAGGQAETKLAEAQNQLADAQRLMLQQDYVGALKLLTTIQRNYPDLKDEVTRRINEMVVVRAKLYNDAMSNLITAVTDQDPAKAQKYQDELNAIDPARSVVIVKSSNSFIKALQLLNKAEALLAAGKAAEALSLYVLPLADSKTAGFDMQEPEFEAAGYGEIVTTSVKDAVARIRAATEQEVNAADVIAAVPATMTSFLARPATADSLAAFDSLVLPLIQGARAEGVIRGIAASLAEVGRTIRDTAGKGRDDPYLQYLGWLLLGREKKSEGIARAIQLLWENRARAVSDATAATASAAFEAARAQYDAGALAAADSGFDDAYNRSVLVVKAAALAGAAPDGAASGGWAFSSGDRKTIQDLLARALAAQENAVEAGAYRTLIADRIDAAKLPAAGTAEQAQLTQVRFVVQGKADAADGAAKDWSARGAGLRGKSSSGVSFSLLADSANAMAGRFTAFAAELRRKDLAYALREASGESGGFEPRYAAALRSQQDGQDLMNGTVSGKRVDENAPMRPSNAVGVFDSTRVGLDVLVSDIAAFATRWKADKPWVVSSVELAALLEGLNGLAVRIAAKKNELARLTALGQSIHQQAVTLKKQGDLAFDQGNKAFTAKQYDVAKLQFSDSSDLYLSALLQEEDAVARARYVRDIPDLITKINDALLAGRLGEVDKLITDARKQFDNGEFLNASNTLQTASDRWKSIQGDTPYPDLDAFIQQVRSALQASTGRDLDPADPKATTVNAYLSMALTKIAAAENMAKTDPARKQYLDDAGSNVQSALAVVEVYRRAKALSLKIRKLQAKDDATFTIEASKEIADALKTYGAGAMPNEKIYFVLKDYQDILPNYPGLKDAITTLETKLGLRIAPPSTTNVATAKSLTSEASASYIPGNADTYQPALDRLNEALRLDPNNAPARALRIAILLAQGSQEVTALSPADQTSFARAKRLYNNDAWDTALPILQDLINTNKRNANYPPLAALLLATQQRLGLK